MAVLRTRLPLTMAAASMLPAAALLVLGPHGTDFAAHDYQRNLFLRHGFLLWNNHWYAGRYSFAGYSLTYYPLAAAVGIGVLAVVSVAAAVAAFAVVLEREWGSAATPAVVAFAAVWPATVVTGAFPFILGAAFAIVALATLQRRRIVWFAALSLLALLSSPLAFGFLALAAVPAVVGRRAFLGPTVVLAAVASVGLLLARLFPAGGSFPFPLWTLAGALAFAVAGAAFSWRQSRFLRSLFLVYGVACVVAYVLPSELGSNVSRLRLFALPLALLVLALRGFRPRVPAAAAVALAAVWNLAPLGAGIVQAADDPAAGSRYWQPAIAYFHTHLTPSYRVEAVATANHWEALYLPRAGIPIARGWFRQDDLPQNGLLYKPLAAAGYRAWLRRLGVRYVLLVDAPLDYSARREAALLRSGRSGLALADRFPGGTIYRVPAPHELITGPGAGRVLSLADGRIRLEVAAPGRYRLAVRYSPYWHAIGACVTERRDGMTDVTVRHPGRIELQFAPSLAAALTMLGADRARCAPTQ